MDSLDRLKYVFSLSPAKVKRLKAGVKLLVQSGLSQELAYQLLIDEKVNQTFTTNKY